MPLPASIRKVTYEALSNMKVNVAKVEAVKTSADEDDEALLGGGLGHDAKSMGKKKVLYAFSLSVSLSVSLSLSLCLSLSLSVFFYLHVIWQLHSTNK